MIEFWELKSCMDKNGIGYVDNGTDSVQFYLNTENGTRVKFFIDIEGAFLECSAYSVNQIFMNETNLMYMNHLNNSIRAFKFSITENNHLRVEYDLPHKYISNVDIVMFFVANVLNVIEKTSI